MFNHSFSQSSSQFGGNISQGQPDQLPPESALWQLYPSEQSQQQLINNLPKQMTECMSCDRLNGFQRGNGQFSSDQCLSLLTSPKFPDRNSSLLTVTNTVIEENGSDPSGTTTEAYLSYLTQAVLPKGKTTMEIHTQLNTIGYLVTCALSTASGGGDGQQVRKQDPFQDLYQLSPGPPRSFQNQPKIRLSVEAVSSILGFLVSNCAEPKAAGISLPIIADLCKLLNPALICARIFDLLNQEDPDLSVSQYKRGIIGKSSIAVNLLDWIHKEVLKQFGFSSIPFDVLVSGVKPFFTHKEQRVRQAIANIVGYIMYIEQNASQAILSSSWAHVYQKQITIESACNMEEVNVNFKKVIETAAKSCGQNDLQPPYRVSSECCL
ncbi:hypothetical protein BLNAU_12737 [Blattamonas nauphoetae]|uniref:Uncharacterized protein n=1 Tax=Blattamonas nauphoetae TaxID=2049346 RepID=A0ABQ9XIS4_9EUKA|nr:hypothetical protein BLNAU_12737 [Blattamonas nauphoetae]